MDEVRYDTVGKQHQGHPLTAKHEQIDGHGETRVAVKQQRHTLRDMLVDYAFFTTAVIHKCTLFDRDPVTDFVLAYPDKPKPLAIDSRTPFFHGFGVLQVNGQRIDFDRRLYAAPLEVWKDIQGVFNSICMIHKPSGFFGRVGSHVVSVIDHFEVQGKVIAEVPVVPVTVFGVSTNREFSYIADHNNVIPTLVRSPPIPEMVEMANAILAEDDPLAYMHTQRKQHKHKQG